MFEPAHDVLDIGVGAHEAVELRDLACLVGEESPVSVVLAGNEAALGPWVQWFAAHYQPGALRPARQVDEVGEVRDLSAAGLGSLPLPESVVPAAGFAQSAADRCLDARRRAC